jgi:hypothetical protein
VPDRKSLILALLLPMMAALPAHAAELFGGPVYYAAPNRIDLFGPYQTSGPPRTARDYYDAYTYRNDIFHPPAYVLGRADMFAVAPSSYPYDMFRANAGPVPESTMFHWYRDFPNQ